MRGGGWVVVTAIMALVAGFVAAFIGLARAISYQGLGR